MFLTLPARMRLPMRGSPSVSEVTQTNESYRRQEMVRSQEPSMLKEHGQVSF